MWSQWESLLKNIGQWDGSFTSYDPNGNVISDVPSIVSLEGRNDNKTVYQVVKRFPPGQPPKELFLEYTSLNRSILFFENGGFSQGSLQWGPYSTFGGEFGLIEGDRRLRHVILYNAQSELDYITLIREKLPNSNTPERPLLTAEQLQGKWLGEAITIYPDFRTPETYATHLKVEIESDGRVRKNLSFGEYQNSSHGTIEGNVITFGDSQEMPVRVMLLPDGGSVTCPKMVKLGKPFFLEVGWLLNPYSRHRMIRSYSAKGEWLSVTWVKEETR